MGAYKEYSLVEPYSVFLCTADRPTLMVGNHWHDYFELLYILEGEVRQTIHEQTALLSGGDIVLLPPQSIHATASLSPRCRIITALFLPGEADGMFDQLRPMFLRQPYEYAAELRALFERMYEESQRKLVCHRQIIRGCLGELIGYVNRSAAIVPMESDSQFHQMKAAFDYIKKHMDRAVPLAEAARAAGYAPDYFTRLCKKYTGLSYKGYVDGLKMARAAQLLAFEDKSVKEAAVLLGYPDASSFARTFRRVYGRSPSGLRQACPPGNMSESV